MAKDRSPVVVVTQVIEISLEEAAAATVIQEKPKRKWTSYFWDTFDKSPEERHFLFKVDAAVLTFASLGTSNPFQ